MTITLKDIYSEEFLTHFKDKVDVVANIAVRPEATSIDIEKIISALGIDKRETKLETYLDKCTIYINCSDSITEQRFKQARELGHYILGHQDSRSSLFNYINYQTEKKQQQLNYRAANQFAIELLMPNYYIKKSIRTLLVKNSMTSADLPAYSAEKFIAYLANDLGVSQKMMEYRLLNLGVIVNKSVR